VAETARAPADSPRSIPLHEVEAEQERKILPHRLDERRIRPSLMVIVVRAPVLALRWLAVGLALVVMLLVAPVIDLAVDSFGRFRRLLPVPGGARESQPDCRYGGDAANREDE
jgi:hypothetical protein